MSEINKAYSQIVIKAVDEEKREIRGIASTPSTDRMGDIVEPSGAEFKLPVPLLWQHDHSSPIGNVTEAKVTKNGIEIVAKLVVPSSDMPSGLQSRLAEAWSSIKTGLVRGLSIGFSPTEYSFLDSGGIHFLKWNWTELSAVTIPANAEASITAIKSLAQSQVASDITENERVKSVGVTTIKPVKIIKPEDKAMEKSISEQIKEFESTRVAKLEEMQGMVKSVDGRTFDAQESEQYDNLEAEIGQIEKHVDRLKKMEKHAMANAKPVQGNANIDVPDGKGLGKSFAVAKNTEKFGDGLELAKAVKCLALGAMESRNAVDIASVLYNGNDSIIKTTQRLLTKAAVAPATTTDATWAKPLVGSDPVADFLEFLRPTTIVGKFGQGGIPSLRNIGFRLPIVGQTSGGEGYWVGETQAKPLTKFDFTSTMLEPLKVANIAVASMEVIRDSRPSADAIIRDQLVAALRSRLDQDFINPAKAAVAGVSPASITNGAVSIPSSGADAAAIRADIQALFRSFIAANNAPTSGVLVMNTITALALSLLQNPLGQSEFPGIGMSGGLLLGLPVIVSDYVPSDSSGSIVVLINASDVYIGDEGGFEVDISREASLDMDTAPANPSTAATVMVSLWQRNLVGFRAERTINWARRRPSAVSYLTGVNWGAGA